MIEATRDTETNFCQKIKLSFEPPACACHRTIKRYCRDQSYVTNNRKSKRSMSSQVELSTSRGSARRGKLGSEKVLRGYIRRTVTSKKRGLASRILYRVAVAGRGLDDPGRQAFTRPFHPLPECSASDLPPRFDTALKVILPPLSYLPVVVPSLPAAVVPAEKDSLPPSAVLLRASANEDNRANTSYAPHYCVCLAQRRSGAWNYKFLTRTVRWSVKPGGAITKLEITVLAAVTRLKGITSPHEKSREATFEQHFECLTYL